MKASGAEENLPAGDDFVPRLPGASREATLHDQLYRYAEDLEKVIDQLDILNRQNQDLRSSQALTSEQLAVLEDLLQGSHQMHVVTDAAGRVLRANVAAAALTADLIGASMRQFVAVACRPDFDRLLHSAVAGEAPAELELQFDGDGGRRLILGLRPATESAAGSVSCIHWLARDLTRARESEFDSQIASTVLHSTTEAVLITDLNGGILSVNPAFTAITGYAANEVLGRNPAILSSGVHDAAFFESFWAAITHEGRWQGEIVNRRKNGETFTASLVVNSLRDDDGRVLSYVAVFSDLSKLREAESRLAHLAYYDSLTELPNRLLFGDRIGQAISSARRFGVGFTLLYVDLDHFKAINDSRGHDAGDHVLREAAGRMQGICRDVDTAARLGGDEFALLLPGMVEASDIRRFCLRLIDALNLPIAWGDSVLSIGASIGCAGFPGDADEHEALLNMADAAMYRAKRAGGNLHVFYADAPEPAHNGGPRIESEIGCAVERGELSLVYQPQLTIGARPQVFGVEALLRWHNPHFGDLMPNEFIPLAERTGAIVGIGRWVLETACRQLRRWWDAGLAPLTLSVNVSPRQLRDPGFVAVVEQVLRTTGIPAEALELEITESEAMLHTEGAPGGRRSGGILVRLREIGVRISIDDFGTGFSSLGRLRTLPIDRIKIDQSFVGDLEASIHAQALSTCIIAMGRALGLAVTAEGVETQAQREILSRQGCAQHQGFLHGRPMTAGELAEWLQGRRRTEAGGKPSVASGGHQ